MTKIGEWLKEHFIFAWRYLKSPQEIGTPFPCSFYTAEKMLKFFPEPSDTGHRYVEFGPGTGAFTDRIIKKLAPNDLLDLVEIDEGFCKLLKEKYAALPNIHIYNQSITDFEVKEKYDHIITAIPPNSISDPKFLEQVYTCYEHIIKDGGVVSAVEYIGTATVRKAYLYIKSIFTSGKEYEQFVEVLKVKEQFAKKYLYEQTNSWLNILPARVTHYKISK